MATWNDIIDQAFVNIGTIQVGESITTQMRTDAQTRLNQLISSLSTEGMTAFNQVAQTFTLFPGTSAYSLGPGGSFNTVVRWQKVDAWRASYGGVVQDGGSVLPLDQFGALSKQAGETRAVPVAVGADTAYPLINVRVTPPPSQASSLELHGFTPITQIGDFTAAISGLPEGWQRMLHFNLAVDLYPLYAREGGIPPELAANAQNSKASLVAQNTMGQPPQQK